jgi:hypothetical protein
MTDGNTKRIGDLERGLKTIERKLARLEIAVDTQRQDNQTGIPPQHAADQKDNAAQRKPSLKPEIPPSPENSAQPQKSWYKTMQGWKTLLEVIGIPFAIGYAVVTYFQWQDLRHNFEVDERAWVKVGYAWPDLASNQVATINGRLVNFGKSPITGLIADATFQVVKGGAPPLFSLKGTHSTHSEAPFFPGDSSDFPIHLYDQQTKLPRVFTTQEIEDLEGGKSYVATFGWIVYSDQFGKHWYRFCGWHGYGTSGTVNAMGCVAENRAGDGKPDVPVE